MKSGLDNPTHLTECFRTHCLFQINKEEGGQGVQVSGDRQCGGQAYGGGPTDESVSSSFVEKIVLAALKQNIAKSLSGFYL